MTKHSPITMNIPRNFSALLRWGTAFVLALCGLALSLQAGRIEFNSRLAGSQIAPNAFVYTQDDLFPTGLNNPNWLDGYAVRQSQGELELGIDRSSLVVEGDFTATVVVRYTAFDRFFNQSTGTETLVVNYDPAGGSSNERIRDLRVRDGVHYAIVEIQQVTISGNVPVGVTPQHVYLESRIVVDRQRQDDGMFSPVSGVAENLDLEHKRMNDIGEMEVRWEFVEGAEEYELEWTFVNAVDDPLFNYSTALAYDFRNNATRVATPFNFYRIPLMYEAGYIIYRIRAIRHVWDGLTLHRVPTRWTSDQYDTDGDGRGTIADIIGFIDDSNLIGEHAERIFGEERDLNWQFSATYVEDGVRMGSVAFLDGTLRQRQQVSKNNADSTAVVGESYYDHQGRPAVQALPAPALLHAPKLRYFDFFNEDTGGGRYDRNDFDRDNPGVCATQSEAFGSSRGAGYYYSSASYSGYFGGGNYTVDATHQHWAAQAHLPDAGGYPFVQTTFTPDATGRIASQSTVGPDHHLGSGHETRYFYGSAEQEDLDKLFGSEVGFAAHYRKNLVVDANGQVSVSYLDGSGEVIATALAGVSPASLIALDSNIVRTALRKDLLRRNEKNLEEGTLLSVTEFLVTSAGRHNFEYQVDDHQLFDLCVPGGCYDCIYDLEITVLDDCGNDVLKDGPVSITISGPELDGQCTPDGDLLLPNTTYDEFFGDLTVGKYTAIKRLKVNEAAIAAYTEHFLANNICLKGLADFLLEEMENVDTAGCNLGCADCPSPPPAQYTDPDLEELCRADCAADWCEALYNAMLNDVSPGGQYAGWQIAGGNYLATDGINVFAGDLCLGQVNPATGNITTLSFPFKSPVGGYVDALGNPAQVNGVSPALLSLEDFIQNWEASWAQALVPYHPEYCYWQWCSGLDAEHSYGENLLAIDTYGGGTVPLDYTNPAASDPLSQTGGIFAPGTPQRTYWDNAWTNFATIQGTTYNLPQVAVIATNCPGNPAGCPSLVLGSNPATQDAEWDNYKRLFFSFRQRMLDYYFHAYHPCVNQVRKPGSNIICGSTNWDTKDRLHPDFSNVNGIDVNSGTLAQDISNLANGALTQNCSTQCAAYRDYWAIQLADCDALSSGVNQQDVLDDLQGVCAAGCDVNNPLGAANTPSGPGYLSPSQGVTFFSFADVITHYYGSVVTANGLCSHLLLGMPMQFDDPVPFTDAGCGGVSDTLYWDDFEPQGAVGEYRHFGGAFNATTEAYLPGSCTNQVAQAAPNFCNGSCGTANCPYNFACVAPNIQDNGLWGIGNGADCMADPSAFPVTGSALFPDVNGHFLLMRGEYGLTGGYTTYGQTPPPSGATYDVYSFGSPVVPGGVIPGKTYQISYRVINLWDVAGKDLIKHRNKYDPSLDVLLESFTATGGTPDYQNAFAPAIVPKDPGRWKYVEYFWTAPNNPDPGANPADPWAIKLTIRNYMLSETGNDFGLDQIMIREVSEDCCIDCAQMAGLVTDFEAATPYTLAATGNFWDLFATYANEVQNFSLTAVQYADFQATCSAGNANRVAVLPGTYRTYQDASPEVDTFVVAVGDTVALPWAVRLQQIVDAGPIAADAAELRLCNGIPQPAGPDPCAQEQMDLAVFRAEVRYEAYRDSVRRNFRERYVARCLEAPGERFERIHDEAEYQYTLYYRDNSGALQATIPPEGTEVIRDPSTLAGADAYRTAYAAHFVSGSAKPSTPVDPGHGLRTRYRYNSLLGVRESVTPDKGRSQVWYDHLGRAIFAQDARQNDAQQKYTYTQYDFLSRPTEVGEMDNAIASGNALFSHSFILDAADRNTILGAATATRDITYTWYDASPFAVPAFAPDNLRNRVSATARRNSGSGPYDYLCHYSYDEHGNVSELVHAFHELQAYGQGYKRLRYEYDLISGNINYFAFQEGEADQWLHRYFYDAANRLALVQTSTNAVNWDRDEKAFYYLHGSRARQEIGEEKVQGLDFAHTIHG
ncbi:MAG: hypothetical protein AAF998_22665, partial [Bacteroidota bacterium]